MKSFTTLTAAVAALVGITSAQVTFNSTTGSFSCPIANGAYCASSSLGGPIIIRCTNGIGQPGNCDDNLAGYFPYGVNYSPCWETSEKSGDAACSKNCIVQGDSGNFNGTFTLPNCTPIPNPSSTSSSLSASITAISTVSSTIANPSTAFNPTPTTPAISPATTPSSSSIPTIAIVPSGLVTTLASGIAIGTGGSGSGDGSGSGSGGGGSGVHNGTNSNSGTSGSATATPVGPSSTTTGTGAPEYTGAANILSAGSLAALGAVFAWFL
ncbi:hypothetical protein SBOR_9520 [Sclerotinia borealis F-4128]|uniref:Uncharacterized protein n=1 Tax=Sclerotinia borealis (strain F-4128) TaxID=1432307 RepID=W9C5A3_SCLBF|nr:hypothetical protein SBOR_9520 [Sclerotinia borealis F-4128]